MRSSEFYWILPDEATSKKTCMGYLETSEVDFHKMNNGQPIKDWGRTPFLLDCAPNTVPNDAPWNTRNDIIVSARLRDLLEAAAPKQIQFLPVQARMATWNLSPRTLKLVVRTKARRELPPNSYFVVNPIVSVDCMDWARADDRLDGVFVDAARVPNDVKVFHIQGDVGVFCRKEIVRLCLRHAIVGPVFNPVAYSKGRSAR